jgi:hypothetical protein
MAKENEKLLQQIKDHFKEALEGWRDNRKQWAEDLDFIGGEQWPRDVATERAKDGRPCLVINKLPAFKDQVTGDMQQARPQIKVRPVDDQADPETAEIFCGLIRHIENVSSAEVAYDTAFDDAVACGFGAWRILTDYCDDSSFDQEVLIKRIGNQFTVYPDPLANEITYEDGRFFFVTEELPRKVFDRMYPGMRSDWTEIPEELKEWVSEDKVRIAEYYYEKIVEGKLYLVQSPDGNQEVVEVAPEEEHDLEVIRERTVEKREIWYCKTNGYEFLEEPIKLAGEYYPIVVCWGKEERKQGKKTYRGLIRHARDPQRLYNYSRSLNAETTSLAPKAPFIMTPDQVQGYETQWAEASKRNYPYLLYNPDPSGTVGAPQRQFPTMLSTAVQQEILISDQEIHDTTGLQLAALGKKSNERSGTAIAERKREGDVGAYGYINSLSRAMKYAGKVMVNLIPKIYDTERIIRILGEDGAEKQVAINQPLADAQGKPVDRIFALGVGKYDVTVTIGPNYTTQRIEAAENMLGFVRAIPETGQYLLDLVAKYQDWPGADEIEKRLRKLLPPGLAELKPGEQPPPPPPPDPNVMMELQQEQLKTQQERFQTMQEELGVNIKRLELLIKQKELMEPRETRQ